MQSEIKTLLRNVVCEWLRSICSRGGIWLSIPIFCWVMVICCCCLLCNIKLYLKLFLRNSVLGFCSARFISLFLRYMYFDIQYMYIDICIYAVAKLAVMLVMHAQHFLKIYIFVCFYFLYLKSLLSWNPCDKMRSLTFPSAVISCMILALRQSFLISLRKECF